MRLAATISSTTAINSLTTIFGLTTSLLAASAIRILNDISIYRRTVALKPTIVIIRSI